MTSSGVSKQSTFRFAAFAVVLLLVSGLVVNLFQEARAIEIDFQTAPTTVGAATTFTVAVTVPANEQLPLESVTAIIEKQASGRTDKVGAAAVTRSTCSMGVLVATGCTSTASMTLDATLTNPNAVSSIVINAFQRADNGYSVGYSDAYRLCDTVNGNECQITHPGYGYDNQISPAWGTEGTGYGYGYSIPGLENTGYNINAGGYGYGYDTDNAGLVMLFDVTVTSSGLGAGTHYLTVLFDTGSATVGQLSSASTSFIRAGGGGGGGGGSGGSGGSGGTGTITVTGVSVTPPTGATAAFRVTNLNAAAGQKVVIQTDSDFLGDIEFVPSTDLNGATIDVVHFPADNPPPGVGNLPPGLTVAGFVQITISSGGQTHTVTIAVTMPPGQVNNDNSDKAVLLKWSGSDNKWLPKGRISLTQNADGSWSGTGTSDCCSDYAVVLDEQDPTAELDLPAGELSGTHTVTVTAEDNLQVSKVTLYVDDQMVGSDSTAPYEFQLNTADFDEGDHTVRVVAEDFVGNTGEASKTSSFAPSGDGGPSETEGPGGGGGSGSFGAGTLIIILIVLAIIGAAGYYFYQQQQKK